MTKVLLTRLWDGHPAGEIVEVEAVTADSMIRKGYGKEYHAPKPEPRKPEAKKEAPERGPVVETATANPAAEQATVTPNKGKGKGKSDELTQKAGQ